MTVRVRIAPSPTGDPHVGTAYIGLLNWCFARRHGGKFILRIEDTDRTRCTAASAQAIYDSLHWLGLDYDEGPDVGGDRGPYVQSERVALGIYRRYADQLITQGDAYPCFCTSADLDAMRAAQQAAAQPIMYDRRCRALAPADAARRVAAGEPHVIRMKPPTSGVFRYQDRLRKKPFDKGWAEIDDQVLLKSDGWPTYHLAAVVDDHLMGISHVIRAEEWLNSLPKHIWLNERLGFAPPEYVHVGLLRNADKSKISKRKNPTSLLWYRNQGFLPEALLNFLALLGHSHPEGTEHFAVTDLAPLFDLDRINVAGPVFDLAKLRHLQGLWFRELPAERMRAEVHRAVDARFDQLLPLLRERVTHGAEWFHHAAPFQCDLLVPGADEMIPKGWERPQARAVAEALLAALKAHRDAEGSAWEAPAIEAAVRALMAERAAAGPEDAARWVPKHIFTVLRVATLGRKESPPLFESLTALGALAVIERLTTAVARLK